MNVYTPRTNRRGSRPRLQCRCGKGLLGNIPLRAQVSKAGYHLVLTFNCKSCNKLSTVSFPIESGIWLYDDRGVEEFSGGRDASSD